MYASSIIPKIKNAVIYIYWLPVLIYKSDTSDDIVASLLSFMIVVLVKVRQFIG